MIIYKQGDIVLIPFPFTDLSSIKKRPGIIISSNKFNKSHKDIIVIAITSHIPRSINEEEYIIAPFEQKSCGLPKPSLIKLGKIFTLDQRLIRKIIGKMPDESLLKLKDKLTTLIL